MLLSIILSLAAIILLYENGFILLATLYIIVSYISVTIATLCISSKTLYIWTIDSINGLSFDDPDLNNRNVHIKNQACLILLSPLVMPLLLVILIAFFLCRLTIIINLLAKLISKYSKP